MARQRYLIAGPQTEHADSKNNRFHKSVTQLINIYLSGLQGSVQASACNWQTENDPMPAYE